MGDYFLGLDYGTGGCKGCIMDGNADVVTYAYRQYEIYTDRSDFSEHDAGAYWPLTCEIIHEMIARSGIDPAQIRSIGTSSALPSLVMIDRAGNPVHRAHNLMDRRGNDEMAWLLREFGHQKIFEVSGNRIEDHPNIVKLLWEKNRRPQGFKKIWKALTIDGYIRYKLCGSSTAHYSAGIFYGVAYNLRERRFETDMLDKMGIPLEILPDFCKCEDIVGYLSPAAAAACGLAAGAAVAGGQVDFNAGCISAGVIQTGDMQMSLGTCGNFGVIHNGARFMESMFNFPFTTDSMNTYLTCATTTTGGQSLRYLKENFGQLETAMEGLVKDFDAYDFLNLQAEAAPVGSDGLIILPYLMGERTPLWDNEARGVVFGLGLNHTKSHLVRAMMEAVAYALYDSFEYFVSEGLNINYPIVMNEGGAKSNLWRRIVTDVFNVPTVLVKSRVGAPYGDAVLAAVATGHLPHYAIARTKAQYVDCLDPIPQNHEKYMQCFHLYRQLYQHLKTDFKELTALKKVL